jgi:hypothetical protein
LYACSRLNKEATSTQLSPVKKRVKESSPPQADLLGADDLLRLGAGGDWSALHPSHALALHPQQTIIIRDSPSPPHSVIEISDDSDDDGDRRGLPSSHHHHHHHHSDRHRR